MSETRSLHVLIAGGGLAGLSLAQGLVKSGHTVEVFERDADLNRKQGYYLHFNAIGGEALRRVLPPTCSSCTSKHPVSRTTERSPLFLTRASTRSRRTRTSARRTSGPRNHTGVHRRTLRQILSGRLGKQLHIGSPVVSYVEDADGVTATLADGSTAHGDVLVGADGIRSAVRSQLLPEVPVIPTGVRGIGVFGRTPLTPELDALMPDILNQGVLMAVDRSGSRLLIATFRPRRAAAEAAKDIAPDVELDDVPAYVMISCSVMPGTVVPPASEWTPDTAGILQESMLEAVATWHPAAQALVRGLDLDSVFAIPFGFLEPAENWEPSRVTIVGDAAHGMLPTLGMGANLALNDAALLTEQLDRYGRGEVDLLEAIGTYEGQMRETTYPILRMTLDHDKNFGGGGLQKAI